MPSSPSTKVSSPNTDLRQQILETALRLFTTAGYFNTSVHDIRREAGISVGAIYHYFPSKEAIAKALYDQLLARMAEAIVEIRDHHASAHDRCRAVVALLFKLTESEPETMQFILYARHREFMPGEKPICSSKPFELMRRMVSEGIEQGEIRSMDPTLAAACLFGGPIRMIHLHLDGFLDKPLPAHLDAVWQCAWNAVARQGR